MAGSILDTANSAVSQIGGAPGSTISSFGALFGNSSQTPAFLQKYYKSPTDSSILSTILLKNWDATFPYSFAVVNTQTTQSDPNFAEFPLPINPQDLSQNETFAINIKPTQGGTIIQHSGNRYRDLMISGTTGNFPNKAGGVTSQGYPIFAPTDLNHTSGYAAFLALRNYFRSYYQYKAVNNTTVNATGAAAAQPDALNAQLVFKNYKDGEFQYIEITSFQLKRSSSKPFMYDYTITAKVLGTYTFTPQSTSKLSQVVGAIQNGIADTAQTARGIILGSQQLALQVANNVNGLLIGPLSTYILVAQGTKGNFLNFFSAADLLQTDYGLLTNTGNLLSQYGTADVVQATLLEAQQNAVLEKAGLGNLISTTPVSNTSPVFAFPGATPPTAPSQIYSSMTLPSNIPQAVQNAKNPYELLAALGDNLQNIGLNHFPQAALTSLLNLQEKALLNPREFYLNSLQTLITIRDNAADLYGLSNSQYNTTFNRTTSLTPQPNVNLLSSQFQFLYALQLAINTTYALLTSSALFGSTYNEQIQSINEDFNNVLPLQTATSTTSITFPYNTTLERIALKYLGNPERWIEIAVLNNLVPPYVITDISDTTPNVIHPGQTLLLPSTKTAVTSSLPQAPLLPQFNGLSQTDKNFGIDLKVNGDFDLDFTNTGDINLVEGFQDLLQAVILKLGYEKGDLLYHPEIGAALDIGSKTPNILNVQSAIFNAVLSDPRIQSISNLSALKDNGTVKISFDVLPMNFSQPLPITLIV